MDQSLQVMFANNSNWVIWRPNCQNKVIEFDTVTSKTQTLAQFSDVFEKSYEKFSETRLKNNC